MTTEKPLAFSALVRFAHHRPAFRLQTKGLSKDISPDNVMNPHLIIFYFEGNNPTLVGDTTQAFLCEYLILAQSISDIAFSV